MALVNVLSAFRFAALLLSCSRHTAISSPSLVTHDLTSRNNPYFFDPSSQYQVPSIVRDGFLSFLMVKWSQAKSIALLEQAVEDHNAEYVATCSNSVDSISYRRLIVLPLDDRFDPPVGVFSHGHVFTGDKISLPRVFWDAITKSKAEVPWLFEVSRVDGVTSPLLNSPFIEETKASSPTLPRAVGGALDFRSPDNYAFLPPWMMKALSLRPRDVVDIKLVTTTPPGSAVKLRPHTNDFMNIGNHQAVLETELKHYSALTLGSTIPFYYRGKTYFFDVVDLRSAPRGERVPVAKVQDCDIAAEFVRPKDQMKKRRVNKDR